jgi:hypothetical protein
MSYRLVRITFDFKKPAKYWNSYHVFRILPRVIFSMITANEAVSYFQCKSTFCSLITDIVRLFVYQSFV